MRRARPAHEDDAGLAGELTLGETLRKAREKKNMTAHDVAAKLRLNTGIITALEGGAIEGLPAPTYVRGYIRAYARLLGLDPTSMIMEYDRTAGAPPEIEPQRDMPEPQVSASDLPVKAMTYAVIIVLAALTVMGLLQNYQQSLLSSLSLPKWAGEGAATGTSPAGTRPNDAKLTSKPAPPAAPQPPALSYTYPVLTEAGLSPEGLEALKIPATEAPATADNTAPTPAADAGADVLNMEVSADSWIDVSDNTGARLYYNVAHNGDHITAQGALPYRVRIGRMSGVRLNFRGAPLDVSDYTHDGVARFKLTDQGAAPP
ncbi:MAG TPA: RodZ domain-containing protein [Gammaproteobacteria bacterium]|nr:RodZ domain-containing protein [Gammaproteobacteria bacterium]